MAAGTTNGAPGHGGQRDPLTSRRALVTGAASGIGRAVVQKFLAMGFQVAAMDLHPMDFQANGLIDIPTDVGLAAQVDAGFAQLDGTWGGLDVLVSNAGVGIHERLDEGDPDKWAQVVQTNLIGAMRVVRAFVPLMLRAGCAGVDSPASPRDSPRDIVVVSSVADHRPYTYGGAYSASKAGLSAMAQTLRLELLGQVRVTLVRPGMVQTAFFQNSIDQSTPPPKIDQSTPPPKAVDGVALAPAQVAEAIAFAITRPPGVVLSDLTIRPAGQSY